MDFQRKYCIISGVVFFMLLIYVLIIKIKYRKSGRHYFLLSVFILYIMLVLQITGFGSVFYLKHVNMNINLIPFVYEKGNEMIVALERICNMLLFMPFGILIPLLWRNFRSYFKILGIGFTFSFLIEISQLLTNRLTDINDLIMNTIGILLGYTIFNQISRKKCVSNMYEKEEDIREITITVFLVIFLYQFIPQL